jgi:cytochrome c-type biogenesis protein CcmE
MQPTVSDQSRRRTRRFMLGALVVAAAAFAVMAGSGVNQNLVYYWTPTDLLANGSKAYGATIRLGGMVTNGSIQKKGVSGVELDVNDGKSTVHVKCTGVAPQMLRDGIGVVVEGTMKEGGWFESNRLMVSHNNEYKAPAKGHPMNEKELKKLMESAE